MHGRSIRSPQASEAIAFHNGIMANTPVTIDVHHERVDARTINREHSLSAKLPPRTLLNQEQIRLTQLLNRQHFDISCKEANHVAKNHPHDAGSPDHSSRPA